MSSGFDDVAAALAHLEAARIDRDRGIRLQHDSRCRVFSTIVLVDAPADQLLAGLLVNARS